MPAKSLSQYRTLILPDCRYLTRAQSQLLNDYLENNGRLLVIGELGANLPSVECDVILNHKGTRHVKVSAAFDLNWLPLRQQLQLSIPADLAVNLQRVEGGVAIHILRYDYDSSQDKVPTLEELNLDLRLPGHFSDLEVFSPGESLKAELEGSDGLYRLSLSSVPLYSILLLKFISNE